MIPLRIYIYFLALFSSKLFALEVDIKGYYFDRAKFNFFIENFVDARMNKEKPVGYTRIGVSNRTEALTIPKNFNEHCYNFFRDYALNFDTSLKFICVINQVTIQESHSGGKEYSTASLSIDFYKSENDSCNLYFSSFVISNIQDGIDITKKHCYNLCKVFYESFSNLKAFVSRKSIPFESNKKRLKEILHPIPAERVILTNDSIVKDGLYYSSSQLSANNPSLYYARFLANIDTSENDLMIEKNDSLISDHNAFAFSKGNCLYINCQGRYFIKSGVNLNSNLAYFKNLKIKIRTGDDVDDLIARILLGNLFGFTGSMVGSLYFQNGTSEVIIIPKRFIDLETGLVKIGP